MARVPVMSMRTRRKCPSPQRWPISRTVGLQKQSNGRRLAGLCSREATSRTPHSRVTL
nr:hypothetical protein SHINE37_43166 [Rhizobiaceae bacterium]